LVRRVWVLPCEGAVGVPQGPSGGIVEQPDDEEKAFG